MEEQTSLIRTFEISSPMEYANFVGFARGEGYIFFPKYEPESGCYNIKKRQKDSEGSIFSFAGELELRVMVGSELEELTDKFIEIDKLGEDED